MARRYDSRTTTFSPDGRLYQVEYAMEAVGHAGTCLSILTPDGIVLACERQSANKLLDEALGAEKMYRLSENMLCGVAGVTSDANVLVWELRVMAQRYAMYNDYDIPCEQLVAHLSDVKQSFTQYGGKRPFGVSFLYVGWDEYFGYQLYLSDPSGNYSGWKAACIGSGSAACISLLKQEYKENDITLTSALPLAIKVLAKSIEATKFKADRIELATLVREGSKTNVEIFDLKRIQKLIAAYEIEDMEIKRLERLKLEKPNSH